MASSFVGSGVIGLAPALAVMLGANVGTALVSWALSFDTSVVFPVLLLAGLITFRSSVRTRSRNIGRAMIGLGLMLLALHLLVETVDPGAVAPEARDLVTAVTREPLIVFVLCAVLAWAMHSSIAAVLVIASLAAAGLVGPVAALAMVLGANLGSALNPLVDAISGDAAAVRLPLGNLVNRLVGCALALPFLPDLAALIAQSEPNPGRMPIIFHLLFNTALALLFLLVLPALARALEWALPARPIPDDPSQPRYLDTGSLATPPVALANASREILRMADVVEAMLDGSRDSSRATTGGLLSSCAAWTTYWIACMER